MSLKGLISDEYIESGRVMRKLRVVEKWSSTNKFKGRSSDEYVEGDRMIGGKGLMGNGVVLNCFYCFFPRLLVRDKPI